MSIDQSTPPAGDPTEAQAAHAVRQLRDLCGDHVHLPGEAEYDAGRFAWNAAVEQRPAAVAVPQTVEQVSQLVRTAARLGLRVSAQSTGHAAAVLAQHDLSDVVLVRTAALDGVFVDPQARTVRVESGATWGTVVAAAAPHGLAGLHGSSPGIGVVGYSVTGGLGWYARKLGLAANSIVGVELVAPDGEVLRADARNHPDLFWAVRGGGCGFGLVTALELQLFPVADVYGGMLLWDIERADEVVRAWAQWCLDAPEEVTTSLRVMRFPELPELPDFLRGRAVVIIDGAVLLDDPAAGEVLAPLRGLAPELDTFGRMPASALPELHMDPLDPTPSTGAGVLLDAFDDAAVDRFLAEVGAGVQTPVFVAELRQLGGSLARPDAGGGALPCLPGSHAALFLAIAATPELAAAGDLATAAAAAALAPWSSGRSFLNLAERPVDPGTAYDDQAWRRLQEVRAQVDPDGVFLANHSVRSPARNTRAPH